MIRVINILGKGFNLPVETTTTERITGDGDLSFTIVENEDNKEIVSALSKMWRIKYVGGDTDDKEYVITLITKTSNGHRSQIDVTAKESHIVDMKKQRIYDNITGNLSDDAYFDITFRDSGFTYEILGDSSNLAWENAGDGESRFDMFKNGLSRYGYEYEYIPSQKKFSIKPYVNKKANYYISSKVNATNFNIEEDASEIVTYIRGYGDFDDNSRFQEAGIQLEYTHPLANVIGKYEAEPFKDGKIKNIELLKAKMEEIVDNSVKVSLSLNFLTLLEDFPEAVPKVGHMVKVNDDVTDIYDLVRIVEVKTTRDANGDITKQDVTLGDYKRHKRYMAAVSSATSFVKNISGGSKSIATMQENVKNVASTTTDALDFVSALNASADGLKSASGLNIVSFTNKATIETSNDGGNTFTPIINGEGLNMNVLPLATQSSKGLMSKEDKIKLDGLSNTTTTGDTTTVVGPQGPPGPEGPPGLVGTVNIDSMILNTNVNKWPSSTQSVTLGKKVSDCITGIVLVWRLDAVDDMYHYQHIPKYHIKAHSTVKIGCAIPTTSSEIIVKTVILNDTTVTGIDDNSSATTKANKVRLHEILEY